MKKWIFREHRASLKEAMNTCRIFDSLEDLINYACTKTVYDTSKISINISFYCDNDDRINWKPVYIVFTSQEVIGFCTFKEC